MVAALPTAGRSGTGAAAAAAVAALREGLSAGTDEGPGTMAAMVMKAAAAEGVGAMAVAVGVMAATTWGVQQGGKCRTGHRSIPTDAKVPRCSEKSMIVVTVGWRRRQQRNGKDRAVGRLGGGNNASGGG